MDRPASPKSKHPRRDESANTLSPVILTICILIALIGAFWAIFPRAIPQLIQELNSNQGSPNKVTLRYFNSRGRAEAIRLLLEETKIPYEDYRIERNEWLQLKPNRTMFPFAQAPTLELPGPKYIAQSGAIVRYIARVSNLYGRDTIEATLCDMIAGSSEDLRTKYGQLVYSTDFENQRHKYVTDVLPSFYGYWEQWLTDNGAFYGKGNFFVGDQLTFADILIYDVLDINERLAPGILEEKFPLLYSFKKRIESRPRISAYLQSQLRKSTPVNGASAYFDNSV